MRRSHRNVSLLFLLTGALTGLATGVPLDAATLFATPELVKLSPSDASALEQFGSSVAIDGDVTVVGASNPQYSMQGAYVFERNRGGRNGWGEVVELAPEDSFLGDYFGRALDVSGDTVVVGAQRGDCGVDYTCGAAYVFGRNAGGPDNWGQVAKITAADGRSGDFFGLSVAIDGDVLVVGAPGDGDPGLSGSGSAYVFGRNAGGADNWGQVAKLLAPDPATSDGFGRAVAIHGERIAVGAPREDVAPGCVDVNCNSGTAYLFERNEGGADTWGRVRTLDPGVTAPGDQFGSSLALDGDLLVVGAPTRGAKGVAFVFERDEGGAGSWGALSQLAAIDAEMIPPTNSLFGDSVGISGDLVVVGMPLQSSGSAYAFGRDVGGPGAWGHVQKVTGSDVLEYDGFGTAVAISGDTIVAGAPRHSAAGSRSGTAYVFDVTETGGPGDAPLAPDEVDQAVATDGADGDLFGAAIAISGSTMVVGAPDDDGGAGSAYVFRRDPGGEEWSQVRKLVGAATADRFGSSVAIDGDTIAVGAPESDEAAACSGAQCDAGSVYVFDRDFEPETPLAPVSDNWGLVTRLEAADADVGDRFGAAVAIDRGRIVAGAPADDDAASCLDASCDSGSVYLFERNHDSSAPSAPSPEAWGQRRKLTLSAGVAQDRFGSSVAIDGDTLAVGAPGGSTGVAGNAAYVFTRNTGGADAWGEAGRLIADDASTGDAFGVSVGVSRDRVVVGAPRDGNASGSAYLFERNAGGADAWGQLAKLTATDADSGDRFGTAVAIAADTVAIGAWQDYDGGTGSQSGSAYVFERNTSGADAWGQLAKLTASDAAMADSFGVALAFSGRTLAIGASVALADEIGVPAGPGAAYVFETRAPETDLIVSVTDFLDEVAPGQTLVYGVSVDNLGPAPSGATVVSRFPTNALTSCSWVCTTLGNAWCGTQGPVGGDVQDTGVLAVGGGLRYWVTCRIRSDALGLISSPVLALTASPTLDSDPSNNLATDVDSLPPAGDCGPFAQDLFLADQSHDGAVSFRACDTIVAGPSFTVESGGSVSLCAGASIRLGSGFQVAANGSFRATTAVDPVSCP